MDWKYLFTSFEGRISRQPFGSVLAMTLYNGLLSCSGLILGHIYEGEDPRLDLKRHRWANKAMIPLDNHAVFLYPASPLCQRWHDAAIWLVAADILVRYRSICFSSKWFPARNEGPNRTATTAGFILALLTCVRSFWPGRLFAARLVSMKIRNSLPLPFSKSIRCRSVTPHRAAR